MLATALLIGTLLTTQVPPPSPASTGPSDLRAERFAILQAEAGELEALAGRLEKAGDAKAAAAVRRRMWRARDKDGATRFVPLPEVVAKVASGLANVPASEKGRGEDWQTDLRKLLEKSAGSLASLASRATSEASGKQYALADECLRQVLDRRPNHAEARRLLGYVPHDGGWATPYAVKMLREKRVAHPTFGWVDSSWIPHLEAGELPAPNRGTGSPRWLPTEEADRLHERWESCWRIPTEHFQIQANVPLSEAIAFARQLEAFHQLFFALVPDLIIDENRLPLAQRIKDKKLTGERPAPLHLVYYFRDKSEYLEHVMTAHGPGYENSLGLYVPPKSGKTKRAPAYFYRDPGGQIEASATLYHEVSHQLLFESAGPNAYDRNVGNYWVFEGLGTYFETIVQATDGSLSVGGLVGPRIELAKRHLENGSFLPIQRLVQLGQNAFTAEDNVYLHYAEGMALAVFLMQADDERYRETFLEYVRDAYRGRLKGGTGKPLKTRLGVSYETLDREFHTFLRRPE